MPKIVDLWLVLHLLDDNQVQALSLKLVDIGLEIPTCVCLSLNRKVNREKTGTKLKAKLHSMRLI